MRKKVQGEMRGDSYENIGTDIADFGNLEAYSTKTVRSSAFVRCFGLPAVLLLLCLLLVKTYFFNFLCVVTSESMAPTLKSRDMLLVSRVYSDAQPDHSAINSRIKRGDVVVFHTEGLPVDLAGKSEHYVKRVVGLPGDVVEIRDGKIFINGKKLMVPQIFQKLTYLNVDEVSGSGTDSALLVSGSKVVVPENHCFVLGDHSRDSLDSRYWGALPLENIEGKVLLKWWPLSGTSSI